MNDDPQEDLIPIRALVNELPRPQDGRLYHPSTLERWALYGLGGIRLASVKVAGRRYVRRCDLDRFIEECAGRQRPTRESARQDTGADCYMMAEPPRKPGEAHKESQ